MSDERQLTPLAYYVQYIEDVAKMLEEDGEKAFTKPFAKALRIIIKKGLGLLPAEQKMIEAVFKDAVELCVEQPEGVEEEATEHFQIKYRQE